MSTVTTANQAPLTDAVVGSPKKLKQHFQSPNPPSSALHPSTNLIQNMNLSKSLNDINYKNGKKVQPVLFNYSNYYNHREKLPQHYHPLVQYLEDTELKYHNDNLYEDSPIGFPTRAQLLKEKVYHLPILNDTPAEKAKFKRKQEEQKRAISNARRKYDFQTYDNHSSHYFLTGARFNRNDTIDSKMLNKYGVFINKHNTGNIYIKSNVKALESFERDILEMEKFASLNQLPKGTLVSKSVQVEPPPKNEKERKKYIVEKKNAK